MLRAKRFQLQSLKWLPKHILTIICDEMPHKSTSFNLQFVLVFVHVIEIDDDKIGFSDDQSIWINFDWMCNWFIKMETTRIAHVIQMPNEFYTVIILSHWFNIQLFLATLNWFFIFYQRSNIHLLCSVWMLGAFEHLFDFSSFVTAQSINTPSIWIMMLIKFRGRY